MKEVDFNIISQVVEERCSPELLIIYGSAANGNMNPQSDLDLAIALEEELSLEKNSELSSELSLSLGFEIDLSDLRQAKGFFLKEILCHGMVIIKKNPERYAELIKKMWFWQADEAPLIRRIMQSKQERWLGQE